MAPRWRPLAKNIGFYITHRPLGAQVIAIQLWEDTLFSLLVILEMETFSLSPSLSKLVSLEPSVIHEPMVHYFPETAGSEWGHPRSSRPSAGLGWTVATPSAKAEVGYKIIF